MPHRPLAVPTHTTLEAPRHSRFCEIKVPPHRTDTAGRPTPAPASPGPRPRTSLATSRSLLLAAVLPQLLQLLLHQVGLGSGLRELECTANNNNRSRLKAREAFPASQHNRDLQTQVRTCGKEFAPVEQGGSCHTSLRSPGKPGEQLGLLLSLPATKATFQF